MSEPTKEWKELSIEEKFDQLNEGIINTRNQFGESIFHIKETLGDIQKIEDEFISRHLFDSYVESTSEMIRHTRYGLDSVMRSLNWGTPKPIEGMEEPLLDNLQKRLTDLETYIHGPTRKPFDE